MKWKREINKKVGEFKEWAGNVNAWDCKLVSNTEKVHFAHRYVGTLECTRVGLDFHGRELIAACLPNCVNNRSLPYTKKWSALKHNKRSKASTLSLRWCHLNVHSVHYRLYCRRALIQLFRLDQELKVISSQQAEIAEILQPLEAKISSDEHTQVPDDAREETYVVTSVLFHCVMMYF